MIQCERVCSWVLYKTQKLTKCSFRVQGSKIVYSIMHLALLGAMKRLILSWKEFHIDHLGYSDHKIFKKVGRNCWTASNRICAEATWIWWYKKMESDKITTVKYFESSVLCTISDLFSFSSKRILTARLTCCKNSFRWKWN